MVERFTDLEKIDTFPEEVQHEINEYEGMGRELVYVEHIQHEENNYWTIVYFEPLTSGETSPYDVFWFASLSYMDWPKPSLMQHFYSLRRLEAERLAKHEGQAKKQEVA